MTIPSPLLQNLLGFVRLLRGVGLRVTTGQLIELASALELIRIRDREDFKSAARCVLVNRHDDLALFDRAFDLFWRAWSQPDADRTLDGLVETLTREVASPGPSAAAAGGQARSRQTAIGRSPLLAGESEGEGADAPAVLAIYSADEVLRHKDFARLSGPELADARRFLAEMRWSLIRRRSLRTAAARRGRRLDARRSLRRSLARGGELTDLAWQGPKLKRRHLVVLCDISGSMERYTQILLHFLHSVESSAGRSEVFVFGTRLTRITPALRRRDPDGALAAVAHQVKDWSGGTRIGESLHTFNRHWARRVLGHGAIVIVISDGWDRGDPDLLAREMERLQRASYRLIWLNPLLGGAGYQPLTQGIRAALPYVDDFLPVHNLASLEALAVLLNEIQGTRPARRQVRPRLQSAALSYGS
ncbi:MAG TPA: VWA domain-containing protein [Chloroflexota bacterium]|nr:VWA domain-containing protein [Chloroflexota bacterium]